MSYRAKVLEVGLYNVDSLGDTIGVRKGDTRSLDLKFCTTRLIYFLGMLLVMAPRSIASTGKTC